MNNQEKKLKELASQFGTDYFSAIASASEDYFYELIEFHKLNDKINRIKAKDRRNIQNRSKTLVELRAALREIIIDICNPTKLRRVLGPYLSKKIPSKSIFSEDRINEATEARLRSYLPPFRKKIIRLFLKFRKSLPMDFDFIDLLEIRFYPGLEGKIRSVIRKNTTGELVTEENIRTLAEGLIRIIRECFSDLPSTYPALFDPENRRNLEEDEEELQDIKQELSELRNAILSAIPTPEELLEFVRENKRKLSPAVTKQVLKSLVKSVSGVMTENQSEIESYPSSKKSKDIRSFEKYIEKRFIRELGLADILNPTYSPSAPKKKKSSHKCNARLSSQKGTCQRQTCNDGYCYQHAKTVPSGDALKLAGKWRMSGSQENVPRSAWKAELKLYKNGRMAWKQTAGANMWAKRYGRWMFLDSVFTMEYRAPKVGQVKWKSRRMRVTSKSMSGEYSTPQIRPLIGKGWGGYWKAQRISQ